MEDDIYTYKKLLHLYVTLQRGSDAFAHQDFFNYYKSLLAKLEQAFGIEISSEYAFKQGKASFFMIFDSTVKSFISVRTPWSGYLESGLLITKLEAAGEAGKRVLELSDKISEWTSLSARAHEEMLLVLFELIYGAINKTVTSEDLKKLGFDDAKKPKLADYDEFIEYKGIT